MACVSYQDHFVLHPRREVGMCVEVPFDEIVLRSEGQELLDGRVPGLVKREDVRLISFRTPMVIGGQIRRKIRL